MVINILFGKKMYTYLHNNNTFDAEGNGQPQHNYIHRVVNSDTIMQSRTT